MKFNEVCKRVEKEFTTRVKIITKTELNDNISSKVIGVTVYPKGVCKFNKPECM